MFQPRQFLKRSSHSNTPGSGAAAKAGAAGNPGDRHPAMRGIDVSPVHGRHCICGRCEQRHKAS